MHEKNLRRNQNANFTIGFTEKFDTLMNQELIVDVDIKVTRSDFGFVLQTCKVERASSFTEDILKSLRTEQTSDSLIVSHGGGTVSLSIDILSVWCCGNKGESAGNKKR